MHCIFSPRWTPGASEPASGVSAAATQAAGWTRRVCAMGRAAAAAAGNGARCAARRWPAAPGTEAPRGAALGRSPAPSAPSSTSDWQCDAPERKGIPEVPRRAPPLPGGRLSSILLPRERDWILLSQPRPRLGPLPAVRTGKFPPLPWHPALVAGGGLPRHPARGARHPLPHHSESGPRGSPALASRPAPPRQVSLRLHQIGGPSHDRG